MNNFIPDTNRFHLSGPPKWFLAQLWEFDPSLVIVPSRQGFYYRLAQRRKLQLPEHIINEALFNESDTKMLAGYSLVPVTTIVATCNWSNPLIFHELAQRAPWRMGGADKVNAMLDEQDMKREFNKRAATDEHLTGLSKDAWKYYQLKTGLRTSLYSPTVKRQQTSHVAPSLNVPKDPLPKPQIYTTWAR